MYGSTRSSHGSRKRVGSNISRLHTPSAINTLRLLFDPTRFLNAGELRGEPYGSRCVFWRRFCKHMGLRGSDENSASDELQTVPSSAGPSTGRHLRRLLARRALLAGYRIHTFSDAPRKDLDAYTRFCGAILNMQRTRAERPRFDSFLFLFLFLFRSSLFPLFLFNFYA